MQLGSLNESSREAFGEQGIVLTRSTQLRSAVQISLLRQFLRARGYVWALIMETVLVVEDEVTTRDTLVELLAQSGREIVTACDGQEAFERLAEIPRPCLIVLDLMMPRMNGFEFLRRQSTNPSIADIPTIVLSGSNLPAAAKHQLAKPIDVERLMALVAEYC